MVTSAVAYLLLVALGAAELLAASRNAASAGVPNAMSALAPTAVPLRPLALLAIGLVGLAFVVAGLL